MELLQTVKYLFDRDCEEEMTEDEEDVLQKVADDLVAEYGWNNVFSEADKYLRQFCISPEAVINFAVLFWDYGWYENPIPDPYHFLAYFYYRIDWQTGTYDVRDILDSLCISILPKAGFQDADLSVNPRYMPENDSRLQKAVKRLREGKTDLR